ncbi:hypothetical protein D1007_32155 [Hordeum vulgare]|nr:hypothetical protein D1007_32155 [Hordeum vulgare]
MDPLTRYYHANTHTHAVHAWTHSAYNTHRSVRASCWLHDGRRRSRPSNPHGNKRSGIWLHSPSGACTRRGRTSLSDRAHNRSGRCTSLARHQSAALTRPGPARPRRAPPGARRRRT